MPISHVSKYYAIVDGKIAKLTLDASGSSPAYAAIIDVPGITGVTISGDVKTSELRGDNTLLDSNSVLTGIKATFTYSKLSLDILPVVLGGSTVDSGTTPNQKATWSLASSDVMSYWKFEGKTPTGGVDSVAGDGHILLHKCILSSMPELGFEGEAYKTYSMEASVSPLLSTGNAWITVTLNETAAAIA